MERTKTERGSIPRPVRDFIPAREFLERRRPPTVKPSDREICLTARPADVSPDPEITKTPLQD